MSAVIIPNYVRNVIDAKLDNALASCPDAAINRERLFYQLLEYYYEQGVVPDFIIVKKEFAVPID